MASDPGDPVDQGFAECWREISAWLDGARGQR